MVILGFISNANAAALPSCFCLNMHPHSMCIPLEYSLVMIPSLCNYEKFKNYDAQRKYLHALLLRLKFFKLEDILLVQTYIFSNYKLTLESTKPKIWPKFWPNFASLYHNLGTDVLEYQEFEKCA